MKARSVPRIILLSIVLILFGGGLIGPCTADAQQAKARIKTFSGPDDAEFPYPAQEGKIGQRDPAAMSEIQQSLASSLLPEHAGLEITGTFTSGSGSNHRSYPATFAIDKGRRFRLDIQKEDGTRTLRINGDNGKARQSNKATQELEDIEFVNPLGIPLLLAEIADRKDAAVVDDGAFIVKEHSMNKVTITLFRGRFGTPVSACFYFDSNTHTLEKGVFIEHSLGNRSLQSLIVMTYGDYRKDQSILLPHEYTETINGQPAMSLNVTNISITSSHDDSYFSF